MANHPPLTPRSKTRMYAWLAAIAGLLLLLASSTVYLFNRAWAFEMQLGFGLGGVLVLGAVLLRPEAVRTILTGRSIKYGSNAVVTSLAFIGILGCLNFISHKNNHEYDLTETGLFTLSEQTIQVLKGLNRPVQVLGFFKANDPALSRARDYLERYSHYTDQLTYEFHDPEIEPAVADGVGLSNYGGLVFVSGDKRYEATGVDEQTITSGLIRVTSDKPRTVYFITGHGEHHIDDGGPEGYSTLRQALEHENYKVDSLNLASLTGGVPENATVVVLAGADRELLDNEVELIEKWMAGGGKLMVLADPMEPAPLRLMLQEYGLSLRNDIIVEDYNHSLVTLAPQGLTPQIIAPIIINYPYHEITKGLNGFQSFFPFARSIAITAPQPAGKHVSALLKTSEGSWAETDLTVPQPEYTKGVDYHGPFELGVAVEDYETEARLVLFGNAGFVTNQNVSPQMANLDIFINAVDWLAEEEALISIRPKSPDNRRLFLTPMQINITLFTTLIVIPLTVFVTGLGIWWKRR